MNAVALGPFMLSAEVIYLIASVVTFFLGAELLQGFWRKRKPEAPARFSQWAQSCFWLGLVGGRLGYVGMHVESYQHDWLSVLYFWQSGYSIEAVLILCAALTFWYLRPRAALVSGLAWLMLVALLWSCLITWAPLHQKKEQFLPDLTLPLLEQKGITAEALVLSQQQGAVILNLWASWCGPCRREMPSLVKFAEAHPEVRLWLVNQGESPQMVRRFIETNDEPIPERLILLDPNQSLIQAVDGVGLPITLAYRDGRLIDSHVGEVNHARLREMALAISER